MGKNIVILSDGTGQEGGSDHNTNVYKLYNMLLHRSPKQIAYYDRGIGTGISKFMSNAGGFGISKNIKDCYRFLHEHYQTGDSVYLFGFSRGAATVRSLSSFIHLFGILPQSRAKLIDQAYKIYKTRDRAKRDKKAKEFINFHHTMWCRIKFVGVWDTVAALGVPSETANVLLDRIPLFRNKFQDFSLSESVENAFHALAVDDVRKTFHPILWENEVKDYQTVKQVWFSGMHTDVGGGYKEHDLSDITLKWMMNRAAENGLEIYDGHNVKVNAQANGHMHDSTANGIGKYIKKQIRSWPYETHGEPIVHQSVIDRNLGPNNKEDPDHRPWITHSPFITEPWDKD